MNDIVFGVRFTVDGKEVTGTARAQADEFRKLGETAQRSNQQAKTASDQFAASLKRQADTLGMTRTQTMAYEASQHQLTAAQRQQVAESIRAIDAHDKQEKILSRVRVAAAAAGAAIVAFSAIALRQMIHSSTEAEQASLRLQAVLRATGHTAGLTKDELDEMAESMKGRLGFDDDELRKSMAVLLTFKAVTKEHYGETLEMSANLARVMGGDLQGAVLQLGKALEDPATGLTALRRSGVSFNETQQEMIKRLVETGRQGEAITLILKTMKEQGLDKVAESMNRGLYKSSNDMKLMWDDLLKSFGKTDAVKGSVSAVFETITERMSDVKALVETGSWAQTALYIMSAGLIKPQGAQDGEAPAGVSGKIGGRINPKDFGGMSPQEVRLRELGAQLEYYKNHPRPKGQEGADLQDYVRQLRQQLELTKQSTIEEKVLFDLQEKRWKNATPALREQAKEYSRQLTLREQEAQILAANLRYYEHLASERDRQNDAVNQFNAANTETLQQLDLETRLIGKSREQQELLTGLSKLDSEYRKASADLTGRAAESARELYEQQKRDLEDAIRGKNAAQRIQDQIDETKNAAKQMNEDLQRGLTDSIFRGFEAGKSFARNFRDALVNMFKTTILTPVIKWIVSPVTGAVTGALGSLGIPGLANAAGSDGGGLGGLSNLGSLASSASNLFGGGAGILGSTAAYSLATGAGASQATMLAAQTGVFGSAGLSATAAAGGSSAAAGVASAIPYIGWALAAYSLIKGLGGSKGGPAHFTGLDVSGTAGMAGLLGSQFTGNSANSKQPFSWLSHDHGATAGINASITGLFADMTKLAQTLGLDASRLSGAQVPFSFRTTAAGNKGLGPTTEEVIAAFQQNMGQISDALALQLMPNLREFAQANETATQTLVRLVAVQEQLRGREQQALDATRGYVSGLPDRLGITGLTGFRDSLAVSEFRSPLDRFGSARALLNENYGRAIGGDLAAVQSFPQLAQQLLGIGRDVYASGPQFAEVFVEVNRQLQDVLGRQQDLQTELLRDIDISLVQSAQDQIAELRRTREALVEELQNVRAELRRIAA